MVKKNNNIEAKLVKAAANVFPTASKNPKILTKKRETIENWDSLNHMQLVSEVETAFGLSFTMDEIVDIEKLADFIPIIQKRGV